MTAPGAPEPARAAPPPQPDFPGPDDPASGGRTPAFPPPRLACWHALSAAQRDGVRALTLPPAQVEFAGRIDAAVEQAQAGDPAALRGLALLVDERPAGFLLLRRGPALPAWAPAGTAVVGALRIDASRQGRGLGTAAVRALPAWVAGHWPDCGALVLRVDEGNTAAIRAYEKAGWTEFGEQRVGRVGVERTLRLALPTSR